MPINFHQNFHDLNPVYHMQRHDRAVKVANRYLSVVQKRLKQMHQTEEKKLFVNQIKNGKKLTYEELRALKNKDLKFEYIKEQLL